MAERDPLSGEAESFLARWSRRKQTARAGTAAADDPGPAQPPPAAPPAPAPVLTDADMPPIEGLGADDDYSGFLSPGVSEPLRRQALRRLFGNPEYNVGDGLDSYSGDYTRFEELGDVVTADLRHQLERLRDLLEPGEPGEPGVRATADAAPAAQNGAVARGADAERAASTAAGAGSDDGEPTV